jgi:hypothetical protein
MEDGDDEVVLLVPRAWLDRTLDRAEKLDAENARLRDQLQAERMKRTRVEQRAMLLAQALDAQARTNKRVTHGLREELKRLRARAASMDPAHVLQQRIDALRVAIAGFRAGVSG